MNAFSIIAFNWFNNNYFAPYLLIKGTKFLSSNRKNNWDYNCIFQQVISAFRVCYFLIKSIVLYKILLLDTKLRWDSRSRVLPYYTLICITLIKQTTFMNTDSNAKTHYYVNIVHNYTFYIYSTYDNGYLQFSKLKKMFQEITIL